MRFTDNLKDVEPFTEETAIERLYSKPKNPAVKILPKREPIPEATIQRLVKSTYLGSYTAAGIEEKKESLRSMPDEVSDHDTLVEYNAIRIINSLKKAIDASAISDGSDIRLEIGEMGDATLTRQAIDLAAAAMRYVDPEHLGVVSCSGQSREELHAIDVIVR